ncbi:phage head closure protein [Dinoroseobacter sp. S375]|uniref:phage head closure protein n=1 Tax=Dinoroseobacter sp. S375 TaxID=3415136 RepID=UPI003C7C7D6A
MNAGKLTERVTIQSPVKVSDGAGGETKTWTDLATAPTVWARAAYRTGNERMENDRIVAERSVVFTIRNRRDLTEEMRILWQGRAHIIRAIHDFGGREMYLKIECQLGVPT